MGEKWSVHANMDARDIDLVMDRRAVIDRKFADRDVFRELREIAQRFMFAYQGDFAWISDVKIKFHQYGKLFDSQVAGILNTMVRCVEDELKQSVRAEIHKQKKIARPEEMQISQQARQVLGRQAVSSTAHFSQAANAGAVQAQSDGMPRMLPDGPYTAVGPDGQRYAFVLRAGRVVQAEMPREKKRGGIKLNMGARPVHDDGLFLDADMQGEQ